MMMLLPRLLLGPIDRGTARLDADVAGLDQPSRPPDWTLAGLEKMTPFNGQRAVAQSFFNQVAANTEPFGSH